MIRIAADVKKLDPLATDVRVGTVGCHGRHRPGYCLTEDHARAFTTKVQSYVSDQADGDYTTVGGGLPAAIRRGSAP